ncbi:MAG: hypothetical protein AB1425_04765 [Actinomycetota bacterium]
MPSRKELPVDLARAGEARHFIAWCGAVAGLGGGRLGDLAVAAEAVLTDIFLSCEGGTIEIESGREEGRLRISISHPPLKERRMSGLEEVLERFLDGHELTGSRAVLLKEI